MIEITDVKRVYIMAKVNDLLTTRFKKASEKLSKMTELAERSSSGKLSSFSGVFRVSPLSESEEDILRNLLSEYSTEKQDISSDLQFLSAITSEVKAINNQAAILHGERIKRAQEILKKYRDGAFSSWLMTTYGNRQTPYNFLQYFELYSKLNKELQDKVDMMPRQAVYTLATRKCPQERKEDLIKGYKGETKKELLTLIRQRFPLPSKDKRRPNLAEQMLVELKRFETQFASGRFNLSEKQKNQLLEVLQSLQKMI